ncbi:MAG: hypothetical protein WBC88_08905 [Candidatus Zixiibacteriota bacterium]
MKRIFFVIACLLVLCSGSFGAEHPFDKGSTMFGITAGFLNASGDLYESADDRPFTAILLMPQVTYFVWPKVGVGGDLLVFLTGQGDNKSTTLGGGPKLTYFFGGKDKKTVPFITSGFYFIRHDMEYFAQYTDLLDMTCYGTRFKIGGGINVMLSDHLGLLIEASYNMDNLTLEGDTPEEDQSESGAMVIITMGLAGFFF